MTLKLCLLAAGVSQQEQQQQEEEEEGKLDRQPAAMTRTGSNKAEDLVLKFLTDQNR